MIIFIINRILVSVLIVWGVITCCFIIMHLAPGDPLQLYVRPDIAPEVVENIRRQLGFNLPVWQQYFIWSKKFISGNFGMSFVHLKSVNSILRETIPNTLKLTAAVFVFQFIAGVNLGIISALKRGRWIDRIINGVILFFYSMPGFWMAVIAVMIFSLKLGWLPSSQMQSMHDISGFWPILWDRISHLILPVTVLSVPFIAYTARFTRDSLVSVLSEPYILAAKTYGLKNRKIIYHYALKNALLPAATLLGLYLPFLLGGAVITEYIFAWPGMGRLTVNAIFSHDYPVILASTFIAAAAVTAGSWLSDILYKLIDPRMRTGKEL